MKTTFKMSEKCFHVHFGPIAPWLRPYAKHVVLTRATRINTECYSERNAGDYRYADARGDDRNGT